MAVPPKDALYCPILEIATETDEPWSRAQFTKAIGNHFSLTTGDMAERIPSGGQRIYDRVDWALHDLRLAGLMERPIRGRFQITSAGRDYLKEHTCPITNAQLKKLEFQLESAESKSAPIDSASSTIDTAALDDDTSPRDKIHAAHRELQDQLVDELLDSIAKISPEDFEWLVADLMEEMGYGEPEIVGRSGDGGIDGIINQDALGLEKVYIQAKRWQNQVGEPEIRNFSGSLDAKGATKGVFVTTSRFSASAQQTANTISAGNKFIRLIDGPELANLMINHDVGVITQYTYKIQKLDENYFSEEL